VTVTVVDGLTRTQIVQYAGASGDFNPIHTDEIFAVEVAGRPSVLAHGMLTMGLVARALTGIVDQEAVRSFGGRFKAPVWPGDTITVDIEKEDAQRFALTARNQDGAEVFTGYATVA
jgi:acyl dehydratase